MFKRIIACLLFSLSVWGQTRFEWDNAHSWASTKHFIVSVQGSGGVIANQTVASNTVACVALMGGAAAGPYVFSVQTVGIDDQVSDAATLYFDWGRTNAAVFGTSGGTVRNNYTGLVGFQFIVPADGFVTHLGRFFLPGNSQVHRLELWDAANNVIAAINVGPSATNSIVYFPLAQSVPIFAGRKYSLFSSETLGADTWIGCDQTLSVGLGLTGIVGVHVPPGASAPLFGTGCTGSSYGPVSMLVSPPIVPPGPKPPKPDKPRIK
jgi:hypothetical protein